MKNNKHTFIFSINSGRNGSQYLAEILGTAECVSAYHEAEPNMSGSFLRMIQEEGLVNTFDARLVKVRKILKNINKLPPGTVYAETNHMFIKTFYDTVMESLGDHTIRVIVLRRYLPSVLKSFINMGYFTHRNKFWPSWMHIPGTCDSAFTPPQLQKSPDQYDLAIGYLLDIEARARRFIASYPDCHIHEIRLEDLQQPEIVKIFLNELGLQYTSETAVITGHTINDRSERKTEISIDTTLEYCEERIHGYIDACNKYGVIVPPLPQMDIR